MSNGIIVATSSRSGSSLFMEVLQTCGAFLGGPMASSPPEQNPRGYFENTKIRDEMKRTNGAVDIERMMDGQGRPSGTVWALKVWPQPYGTLYKNNPGCRWVVLRRDIDSLMASHKQMPWNYKPWGGDVRKYIDENEAALDEIEGAGYGHKTLRMAHVVDGNMDALRHVVEWAGLAWKEAEVATLIDPKLWHYREETK
jgi:hypothetical protein